MKLIDEQTKNGPNDEAEKMKGDRLFVHDENGNPLISQDVISNYSISTVIFGRAGG